MQLVSCDSPRLGGRAAIYARFSSDSQRDESIEIQVEHCTAFIGSRGWEVARVYTDYGVSGTTDARPGFQAAVADGEAGAYDILVYLKNDRFARNIEVSRRYKRRLKAAGLRLFSVREGESDDAPASFLHEAMDEAIAEYYSRNLAVLIRDGIRKNAERCMANGQPMYGWDIVDGFHVVNEQERAVLVRAKDMLLAGSTLAEITRALEPDFRGKRGGSLNIGTLTRMLRRVQNCGTYSYAGHVVRDGIPALWTEGEQEAILDILDTHAMPSKKANTARFSLTGKLLHLEGDDLAPMVGTSGTSSSGRRHYYYKCDAHGFNVRRDDIEQAVADAVMGRLGSSEVRSAIADLVLEMEDGDGPRQSDMLAEELGRIDQTFERIWRAIEDGIAPPGGRERVEALTARREDVERRLADARAAESYRLDRDAVEYWLENMAADLDRQTICETFVKRVVIVGGDLHILLVVDDDVGPSRGGEVLGLFDQANVIPTTNSGVAFGRPFLLLGPFEGGRVSSAPAIPGLFGSAFPSPLRGATPHRRASAGSRVPWRSGWERSSRPDRSASTPREVESLGRSRDAPGRRPQARAAAWSAWTARCPRCAASARRSVAPRRWRCTRG